MFCWSAYIISNRPFNGFHKKLFYTVQVHLRIICSINMKDFEPNNPMLYAGH